MFLKYNLISSTCFKLGYILCFESFFASITTFLLQLMDLIRCFKQNDFGNILFLIQLSKKINWFFATWSQHSNYKTSLIKPAISNLIDQEIPNYYESLWNLEPNLCLRKKKPTLYEHNNINRILCTWYTSTESCALDMEHNHEENEAETLRRNVSNVLQKKLNLKIRSNLPKYERRASTELRKMINLECKNRIG